MANLNLGKQWGLRRMATPAGHFTMVALDDDRKPVAVPPLEPRTAAERRRFATAELRRGLRSEYRARFEALRQDTSADLD